MTIRQTYYDNVDDYAELVKIPGLYNVAYLKTRTLESFGFNTFPFLLLACAKSLNIQKPTVRELNKMFREHILFDPSEDILCQNYEDDNASLLLRVREFILTDNFIRAMQLYLVFLCNQKS